MTAATRRQIQKEETRKVIKETAYTLFEKNGYEQTTMRELAKQAGVGLGTIFTHFPDKSSLLADAFLDDLDAIIEQAFSSLPEQDIIDQLGHVVTAIYTFYAKRPNFSRTLIRELLFLQGPYGESLEGQLSTFLQRIGHLFFAVMQRKEIATDLNVEQCVLAFGSFYFQCLHSALRSPIFDVEGQVQVFRGLMKQFLLTGCAAGGKGDVAT